MNPIRICEDCRWYIGGNTCDAPQNRLPIRNPELVRRDRETGITYGYRWLTCTWQRSFGWYAFLWRACGRKGRWFASRRYSWR